MSARRPSVSRNRPVARRPSRPRSRPWLRAIAARLDSRRARSAATRARQRLRRSVDHWAQQASERAMRPSIGLVGLDVSSPPGRLRGTSWLPVLAAVVVGALCLAVLRMDVIRLRLAVAESFETELQLEEQQRELTVQVRRLRDPAQLARRARDLGFARAERLIDLGPGTTPRRTGSEAADEATDPIELASAPRREARP